MKNRKEHPLDQCALFKIRSPRMLAERLLLSVEELEQLTNCPGSYRVWSEPKPNGGRRTIEEPPPALQRVHKRVHYLLSGVQLPEYLHSVTLGRSYVTNAREHLGEGQLIRVDIERFYPSVRRGAVAAFFNDHLRCAADVAAILAKLLTYDGHLATGSAASPILSFFAHCDMFDEIAELAHQQGLTVTVYVDDITISGPTVHAGTIAAVRAVVAKHRLRSHKIRLFRRTEPKIVTGLMVIGRKLCLPQSRHIRIRDGYAALRSAVTVDEKLNVLNSLGSLVHEAALIEPAYQMRASSLDAERRRLRRLVGRAGL